MIKATYIDHMGNDLTIVNSARVSFGKKSDWIQRVYSGEPQLLHNKDIKLIHYLAKHNHKSPFNHVFTTFHVKAPIFVARQLQKHEYMPWNEISRRYVDSEPEFYQPDTWRGRSANKKQGSSDQEVKDILVEGWKEEYPDHLKDTMEVSDAYDSVVVESALCLYKDMLHAGVAPEQARMVLPQSTMTEWYWSGSLYAFAKMCGLRLQDDAQYETRLVAEQIEDVMMKLYPVSWEALRMYAE